eukprot:4292859-Pleurochrysis_carterae.AAC.1
MVRFRIRQQIAHTLVVDLEHRDVALVLEIGLALVDHLEEPRHRTRHQARRALAPLHGEGLASARLAIRKDANVETVEHRGHQRLSVAEHLLLGRLWAIHLCEFKTALIQPVRIEIAHHEPFRAKDLHRHLSLF